MTQTTQTPPRVSLAHLPTPLQKLTTISHRWNREVFIKRDDLTGSALSGNKVRKLEYLLADAKAKQATHILTCGGEQSNHCRSTALAAAKLGIHCEVFLRTKKPQSPPSVAGNLLLNKLVGATIHWIDYKQYQNRTTVMAARAEELQNAGHIPYIIPEGGSNALGSWGYVEAAQEIASQIDCSKPISWITAVGSGGTLAGLVVGAKLLGLSNVHCFGVCVCDNADYFYERIDRCIDTFAKTYAPTLSVSREDYTIIDGYVGAGYAKSRPQELQAIAQLAREEAIVLDPVYSGKAFYGLSQEIIAGNTTFAEQIVFLHTGGIFGLFPKAEQIVKSLVTR